MSSLFQVTYSKPSLNNSEVELANEKFLIAKRMLAQYRADYPNPADENYGLTPPKEKYDRVIEEKGNIRQ